jgi:ABC-2 type transport system permease protein
VQHLRHIIQLGVKELLSLFRDPVLLFLIVYSFTFSVYTPAKSAVMDVVNASVAVVDEDQSAASRQIRDSLLPPQFLPAAELPFNQINRAMDEGRYTFIIDIPPKFQQDLSKGVSPTVEIITDATAMSQAGRGPSYIQKIITKEVEPFWAARSKSSNRELIKLVSRARFNPNMEQGWFVAVNQIINNISVLAIFLTGAAVLREREHGTIEHL